MAKQNKQDSVVSDTAAPQTNETLTADVQKADVIVPTVKTPTDILATAVKSGIVTQEQADKVAVIINEDFMASYVKQLSADIVKREQDILGQTYIEIQTALDNNDTVAVGLIACDKNITKLVLSVSPEGKLSVMRSNTKTANAVPTGERTKAGKWLFTNGAVNHESLRQFVATYEPDTLAQSLNGTALCNKLKKHINANEWTVVNQDDKSTQQFAVWSAGKYNVQFS